MIQKRYLIPALVRAAEVLGTLATEREGLSLAELNRRLDIPKTTLFRILTTLQHIHFVLFDEVARRYLLGVKLLELGSAFIEQPSLYNAALRHMKDLADETQETIFLGRLEEGEVSYVQRAESSKAVMVVRMLGHRTPAHCTATGLAMLAHLSPQEVDAVIEKRGLPAVHGRAVTRRDALDRLLAKVRRQGYAIVDQGYSPELLCASAPVFDAQRRPCAALTVAMVSSQRPDEQRVLAVAEAVKRTACRLSRELGFIARSD